MCHGADARNGPLAKKSNPPTPDLTTPAFKKRLNDYPGVIVSSVILRPNGDLIPKTLRENGVKLPPHSWTVQDFRDLNQYMSGLILRIKYVDAGLHCRRAGTLALEWLTTYSGRSIFDAAGLGERHLAQRRQSHIGACA